MRLKGNRVILACMVTITADTDFDVDLDSLTGHHVDMRDSLTVPAFTIHVIDVRPARYHDGVPAMMMAFDLKDAGLWNDACRVNTDSIELHGIQALDRESLSSFIRSSAVRHGADITMTRI